MNDADSSSSSKNEENFSFVRIKAFADKTAKFIEKKFSLSEFLANTNMLINNMSTYSSLNSNYAFSYSTSSSSTHLSALNSSSSSTSLNSANTNNQLSNSSYVELIVAAFNQTTASSLPYTTSPAISSSIISNSSSSTSVMSQLNVTMLLEPSNKQQSSGSSSSRKKLESQIVSKISHVFALFNTRVRIELIVIETPDNVIQALANGLHLEMEEQCFNANWASCLEKINNPKYKKQLCNFKLDEILHDLRYAKKSKVFILYSLKSDQFKLLVAP